MKKYFLLLCVGALGFTACNQDLLNIDQKGVTSIDNFYKTDADAQSALTIVYYDSETNFSGIPEINGYNYGPYFALTNFQADDINLAGSGPEDCVPEREFHDFRYANDNVVPLGGYTAFYRSIQKCNLVINNFTKEKLGQELTPTMQRCVAEARVMRAFDHMMLGIYFGTPPIVEKVLAVSDQPANSESQDAVMQWVSKEIDLALPNLDERKSTSDYNGAVKITKGFAYAVKGKALLWKKDYAGAKVALKEVIKSGKYALNANIGSICHADSKGSPESVFEFNVVFVPGVVEDVSARSGRNDIMTFNWRFENFASSPNDKQIKSGGWGWTNPTGDFARALIANDGMDSPRRKAYIKTYDEILYNHQWPSDGSTFTPGVTATKQADKTRGIAAGKSMYGNEGFWNWKTVIHADQGDWLKVGWAGQWNKNFSIMRYAEVLLMYAEACAMTNDPDGLQYLQAIQNRAGSAHVSSTLTLAEVQNEKQFEMWQEGCRSADLIRWGKTATLQKQDFYVPTYKDKLAEGTSTVHEGYVDASNADYYTKTFSGKVGFKAGKHELLPFPLRVVQLNKALKQNPGWD
jgi:hypothetical protein